MMKAHVLAAIVVVVGCWNGGDVLACGDKYLVVSRGTRFERPVAVRQPAAILVYANPDSQLPKALANVRVEATLEKVGYRSTSVESQAEFETALARGGWDLVLVDAASGQSVKEHLRAGDAPVVLPVLYKPTAPQLAQAKHQFQRVLKSPTKSQSFLDAIDDALAERAAARTKADGKIQ
jgi:hypothetical protein